MVVSLNGLGFRRTPIQRPQNTMVFNYYGEHPKRFPNFGKPLQSRIGELRKVEAEKATRKVVCACLSRF